MYVPDNLDMFNSYSARQEEMLSRCPKCSSCGDPIQEEHLFEVDGELYCFDCRKEIQKDIDD